MWGSEGDVSFVFEYCTGGLVRSENEAIILYTVEKKKALFCSLKPDILIKFAAVHSVAKVLF